MFIRTRKRNLKNGTAIDFMLLESYRPKPGQAPKHRFKKQWTIKQSEVKYKSSCNDLLEDVEYEFDLFEWPDDEKEEILTVIKKELGMLK